MSDITWNEFPVEDDGLPQYSQERIRRQAEVRVDPEAKQRIKKWMMLCMISVAGFIDLLDLLLGLVVVGDVGGDSIISVGADFAFMAWFWILGVSFTSSKNALQKWGAMGGQAILEAIPGVQLLPLLTIAVWWTARLTRKEDALKN